MHKLGGSREKPRVDKLQIFGENFHLSISAARREGIMENGLTKSNDFLRKIEDRMNEQKLSSFHYPFLNIPI